MYDEKPAAQESGGSSSGITPKPPDIIAKIEWLRVHGRRHWGLVTLALFLGIAGWMVSTSSGLSLLRTITDSLVAIRVQRTVKDLRRKYREGLEAMGRAGPGAFVDAESDVDEILKLDPRNGHGLYYAGEIKRVKNRSLFTDKSCPIPSGLAENHGVLDVFENDFYRYLDVEKSLPKTETIGDYSAEACYNRSSGYCPQRTAWINHLLANDLYEEAKLSADPDIKADKIRRAIEHAKTAISLYRDPSQNEGFVQCTPTTALIREA